MRTVGADGQTLGNEKIKLPLAHEISARAMARALLRGASAGLDPLPAGVRCSMFSQSATRARARMADAKVCHVPRVHAVGPLEQVALVGWLC